jgi:hypothetical protein
MFFWLPHEKRTEVWGKRRVLCRGKSCFCCAVKKGGDVDSRWVLRREPFYIANEIEVWMLHQESNCIINH